MSFEDLPIIRLRPSMTDDEIAFDCEIKYFRALLRDIETDWYVHRSRPQDMPIANELFHLAAGLAGVRNTHDHAKCLLDTWRQEKKNPGLLQQTGATTQQER